jgi:hypothetical protein
MDVLGGVEPDMGRHHRHEHIIGRPQSLHADALALQVGDAADAFAAEQFVTADHHSGQQHDRFAGVDRRDVIRRIVQTKIDLAARHRFDSRNTGG